MMKILAIETSCDETAVSIVENGYNVLTNQIASSVDLHVKTGGVVPEVAAREHIKQISPVLDLAMEEVNLNWDDIDAIAVTYGPGLISSLLIGVNTAQTLAYIYKKPLIPVHHISGHIYSNFLDRNEEKTFPIMILTVSGGHNDLILMKNHHEFELIGESLDDSAGEAFDKVARMLSLPYPGGPYISKKSEIGDPDKFKFPRSYLDRENQYNFSFSGLKTAVLTKIKNLKEEMGELNEATISDISASFQKAVTDVLTDKLILAARNFNVKEIHLAGGVSANLSLRKAIQENLDSNIKFLYPNKMIYCTDNAAMIASSAYFLFKKDPNKFTDWRCKEASSSAELF